MQRADDDIADHIRALAHGSADVRAEVSDAEEGTSLRLADQHIVASQRQGFQLLGLQLGSLHARFDPGEGGQDRLRGVSSCRLGRALLTAGGGAAESGGLDLCCLTGQGRHPWNAARQVVADHVGHESHHGQASVLELLELHGLHALGILGKLQGIESQVTGLTVHLADPGVLGEELAFDDHGKGRDLSNAQPHDARRLVVARLQGLVPRRLGVAVDVKGTLREDADNCQHRAAAMLQLGLTEPLHMREGHVAVELKVPVVELAEAQRIPRLSHGKADLDIAAMILDVVTTTFSIGLIITSMIIDAVTISRSVLLLLCL